MRMLARLVLTALVLASAAFPAEARKVALVVGNAEYQAATPLRNPLNDARGVAATFRELGFDVRVVLDADRRAMSRAIADFARDLKGADVALFYYSGHALQAEGRNLLVPVDAEVEHPADLPFQTIALDTVIDQMERGAAASLVFLDACRDNPLARSLARRGGTRSVAVGQGLASVQTGAGTLIAFATDPGNVALDGEGNYSPFTEAVLRHVRTPGLEVRQVLTRVRQDVLTATDGQQRPWDNSSLLTDVYLAGPPPHLASPPPSPPAPSNQEEIELAFWRSITDSGDPALYRAYLERFGEDAIFAPVAEAKLATAERQVAAAVPGPSAEPAPSRPPAPSGNRRSSETLSPPTQPVETPVRAERPAASPASEPVAVARLEPSETPPMPPSPAPPLGRLPGAEDLVALAEPFVLYADAQDGVRVERCSAPGRFEGFRPGEPARPVSLGTAPPDAARASFAPSQPGVEGGASAAVSAQGAEVVAYASFPDAPKVFLRAGFGPARVCDTGGARWRSWSFLADYKPTGAKGTLTVGGFIGFIGGLRVHYQGLAGGASAPFPSCLAFEGTKDAKYWIGGFTCRADGDALGEPQLAALLDRASVPGVIGSR